jgi:hypothetical protein
MSAENSPKKKKEKRRRKGKKEQKKEIEKRKRKTIYAVHQGRLQLGVSTMVSKAGFHDLCLEYLSIGCGSVAMLSIVFPSEGKMQNSLRTGKILPKLLYFNALVAL